MGALNYAGRTFSNTPVATPQTPSVAKTTKTSTVADSFRWSSFIAGLVLVISFVLGMEVAVYELVDTASKLAGRLYERAIVAYEDFEQPAAQETLTPSVPRGEPSTQRESTNSDQQLAKNKAALHCMEGRLRCD